MDPRSALSILCLRTHVPSQNGGLTSKRSTSRTSSGGEAKSGFTFFESVWRFSLDCLDLIGGDEKDLEAIAPAEELVGREAPFTTDVWRRPERFGEAGLELWDPSSSFVDFTLSSPRLYRTGNALAHRGAPRVGG